MNYNDAFVPSAVADDIYDILDEHILVASNESVYEKEILDKIIHLLDNHRLVEQFAYTTRPIDYFDDLLIVSWIERGNLHIEHYAIRTNTEYED